MFYLLSMLLVVLFLSFDIQPHVILIMWFGAMFITILLSPGTYRDNSKQIRR